MGEPKSITYKEVQRGRTDAEAGELWRTIGDISGAGHVPVGEDAAIDVTGVSDAKRERIDKLVNPEQEVVIDEAKEDKKRGTK